LVFEEEQDGKKAVKLNPSNVPAWLADIGAHFRDPLH
jgi:hypothetical protein